jgi:hypothetical protein
MACASGVAFSGPRIIQITADNKSTFKVAGEKAPIIYMKPGEVAILRITAQKNEDVESDGAVHSLTITSLKDQGWDIRLKEGTHDYPVTAPAQPGTYPIECAAKCGKQHYSMKAKLVVQ